jgi:Tol biopolymer transport system component
MNGISHKQAIQLIHRRLDGLLNESQLLLLHEHLNSCDSCRVYSINMDGLAAHLQNEFHHRWDEQPGPSQNIMEHVMAKAKRIPITNRISSGVKLFAGATALVVMAVAINFVVSRLQSTSPVTNVTETVNNSSLANERLLAFTSDQNGNFDIYTMHADGNGLTNITNNPAYDADPFWSPDGKRIAFTSGRDGSSQIYLMDADGSNVVPLTDDETDHMLVNYHSDSGPWSPDGSKLVILQGSLSEEKWILYTIDANGKNKTPLVNEPNIYSAISWSPDGKQIAFLADDPQNLGGDRLYVVNADGSNLREVTNSLQQNEQLANSDYYWSFDGQSIFFIGFLQRTNPIWTAYEVRLHDNSLIKHSETTSFMHNWQSGITIVTSLTSGKLLEWMRPDGTTIALDPYEKCQQLGSSQYGAIVKRSYNGNWIIFAYCPNGDLWLYWSNLDGTMIKQLLDSPIPAGDSFPRKISWSPDGKLIALNITSSDKSDIYVLNISESLDNHFIQPVKIPNSFGPSWQPVVNNEVVEEEPTPEPTQVPVTENFPPIGTGISNGEWIAFIGGEAVPVNQDVYMIHPDGSGLVNLTQSPAHYYYLQWSPDGQHLIFIRNTADNETDIMSHHVGETSPEVLASTVFNPIEYKPNQYFKYSWSPDSRQIAFLDKRAGNYDIYTIDADGSNEPELRQLTNDPGQEIDFAWSPDGSQIAFQRTNGEQLSVMVMNADGSNPQEVARGIGRVSLRWSMDGKSIYANSGYRSPTESQPSHLECEECVVKPAVYRIDVNEQSVQQIYYIEDSSEAEGWHLYDTPQNTLYFMRVKPQSFVGIWGTWFRADGNSVEELGELDPHQTCKATTGNTLNEHFSPNNRFSIISNFCAGGFDLYLADREAPNPQQRITHLLRLPLNTWGQGGDNATLPMLWSPDGRWLVYDDGNQSVYLLDIEQILQDPTTEPVILFQSDSNLFMFSELAWQPKP